MKKIENIIISSLWGINIVILLIMILIDKSENLYNSLYLYFLLSFTVIPGLLMGFQAYTFSQMENKKSLFIIVPPIGTGCLILLSCVNFISSLQKGYHFQMIVIVIVFILLEMIIGYELYFKKYSFKKHVLLLITSLLLVIALMFISVIMSYDHSVVW